MSEENIDLVKRVVGFVNERAIDEYLACCTEDVRLITPLAGVDGAYDGREGIRRFFADVADTGPDFKITIDRLEEVAPNRILALTRVTATFRASGIPTELITGHVYDIADGKIKLIRIFADRDQALEVAGLRE